MEAYQTSAVEVDTQPTKISKINSADLIKLLLHDLSLDCKNAVKNRDYELWNIALDQIWTVVASDLNPTSKELKEYLNFQEKLNKYDNTKFKNERKGFQPMPEGALINRALQYNTLLQKQIWLRTLLNAQGKGTAYKNDLEDDFE